VLVAIAESLWFTRLIATIIPVAHGLCKEKIAANERSVGQGDFAPVGRLVACTPHGERSGVYLAAAGQRGDNRPEQFLATNALVSVPNTQHSAFAVRKPHSGRGLPSVEALSKRPVAGLLQAIVCRGLLAMQQPVV
jgi:hypothetical protein